MILTIYLFREGAHQPISVANSFHLGCILPSLWGKSLKIVMNSLSRSQRFQRTVIFFGGHCLRMYITQFQQTKYIPNQGHGMNLRRCSVIKFIIFLKRRRSRSQLRLARSPCPRGASSSCCRTCPWAMCGTMLNCGPFTGTYGDRSTWTYRLPTGLFFSAMRARRTGNMKNFKLETNLIHSN